MMDEEPVPLEEGTWVVKCNAVEGDGHPDGSRARVLGHVGPVFEPGLGWLVGYFVEWDDLPGVPCFVAGHRVKVDERVRRSN